MFETHPYIAEETSLGKHLVLDHYNAVAMSTLPPRVVSEKAFHLT